MKCSPALVLALVAFAAESVLAGRNDGPGKHDHPGFKWDKNSPAHTAGHHPSRVVSVTTASTTVTAVSTVTAISTVTATSTVKVTSTKTATSTVTNRITSTATATVTITTAPKHHHRSKTVSATPTAHNHKRDANEDEGKSAGGYYDHPTGTDASSTSAFPTDTSNVSVTPVDVPVAATQSPISHQLTNMAASNQGSFWVLGMGLSAVAAFFV